MGNSLDFIIPINFNIKSQEMLTNVHEKQTEQLARKHGRAVNQKSSFTNLLKGKIVKSQRVTDDKENEKALTTPDTKNAQNFTQANVLKIKEKINTPVITFDKKQKLELDHNYRKKYQINRNTHESSMETISQSSELRLDTQEYEVIAPLSLDMKKTSKLNTFESQIVCDSSCMTDECYYQKQLQVKVEILKKERDQLWDSFNGIVRQNNMLKQILEANALKRQTSLSSQTQTEIKQYGSSGFQTDFIQLVSSNIQTDVSNQENEGIQTDFQSNNSVIIQTEISNDQLQLISLRYEKALKERYEVLQFCETLYLQNVSQELFECLNMKDAIAEYISIKIDGLVKQFESEKGRLNKMYEQYINKFKKNQQDLLERNQSLLIDLHEAKIVNKKLQQDTNCLESKIKQLEQSNFALNNELFDAQQQTVKYQKQTQLIKQSITSEKKCWEQKKETYSKLLTASHRTINNLMAQMKEFEELASSTYYKRFKMEKTEQSVKNDI